MLFIDLILYPAFSMIFSVKHRNYKNGEKMFKCENTGCKVIVKPRQPENRIVVEIRETSYLVPRTKKKKEQTTYGWEIVKEIKVCPDCYREITGEEPRLVLNPVYQLPEKIHSRKKKRWKPKAPSKKKQNKREPEVIRVSKPWLKDKKNDKKRIQQDKK